MGKLKRMVLRIFRSLSYHVSCFSIFFQSFLTTCSACFDSSPTVEKLAENNHIDNIHLIYVDQELVIDGPVAPVATPAPATYAAPAAQDETVSAPVAETPVVSETVVSTVSGSEAEAKEWIAQKESGGSYTATNGRYIGRYQLTDSYLNGDYSAENQERVADAYVAGRYGSWTAAKNFWLNNGWY
ncbi:LysM domain protein [Streptococcus pneumoniae]|nr:LysM domain protein [Streptococcus pneumoniae]